MPLATLHLIFDIAILVSLSTAQDQVETDNYHDDIYSYIYMYGYRSSLYGYADSCTRKYRNLRFRIVDSNDLMDDLTELYFETGKTNTEFVTITYRFGIPPRVENETNNDTTACQNDTRICNNSESVACVEDQKIFIWSSAALYLLGPKPLLWLTLFAVHVRESSITIQLPLCLCSEACDELLSRLTYLIKTYPARRFDGSTQQFINTYFFEAKAKDEDNYKNIMRIFAASIYFPCATFIVFSYFAFFYSELIAKHSTLYLKGEGKWSNLNSSQSTLNGEGKSNVEDKQDRNEESNIVQSKMSTEGIEHEITEIKNDVKLDEDQDKDQVEDQDKDQVEDQDKQQQSKRIVIKSLIISFAMLTIALFAFHIMSAVRLIQYGNEVLNGEGYNDDQCVLIFYIVFSFFPAVILIFTLLFIHCGTFFKDRPQDDADLGVLLQFTLGGFIVYLGFYFLPYMLLAFIHDPIQTGFIYLIGVSLILCVCLLTYSTYKIIDFYIELLRSYQTHILTSKNFWCQLVKLNPHHFTLASGVSIAYFVFILILNFILTLGNLHDFQAVQNLTLPLIIGLLSVFVLKTSLKRI